MIGFINPLQFFQPATRFQGETEKLSQKSLSQKEYNRSSDGNKAMDERYLAILEILRAFEQFKKLTVEAGQSFQELHYQFCYLYNNQNIQFLENNPYEIIPQISRASLYRWLKKAEENPCELGRPRGGANNKGSAISKNQETEQAVLICLKQGQTRWSISQILKVLTTQFSLDFVPSESQIRRFIKEWKGQNYLSWLYFKNKDEFKSKAQVSFGKASEDLIRANQRWELDGTKTDVMLMTENGMKRYQLIGLIDVYTRRVKLHLAPSESSQNTLHALRDTIIQWGLPESILTDNGSGFKAQRTQAFLARLGIELRFCPPGQPQKKPHIERFFKTFNHDLLSLLPGFIGHSVAERQALRSHGETIEIAMTPDDFQTWCNRWCNGYETRIHSSLDCSPLEKYMESVSSGFVRKQIDDIRTLDYLLMDGTPRKVRKDGIQVNNRIYIAMELGGIIGNDVYVCFDNQNPDEIIVYSDEMLKTFICKAQWRDSYLVDKVEITQQAKARQNEVLSEAKTKTKEARKVNKKLEIDPFSLLNETSVTPLQKTEKIENHSVTSISQMIDSTKPVEIVELTEQEIETRNAEISVFRAKKEARKQELLEGDIATQQQRFKQLYLLKQKGGDLSQADHDFIDFFSRTPGGKVIRDRLDSLHRRAYG